MMTAVVRWCLKRTHTLECAESVPSDRANFVANRLMSWKWITKYLKRALLFHLLLQGLFERRRRGAIPQEATRMLWINLAAPSLGDSLMDLAAREMLTGRDLDLLTSPKNASLYAHDAVFRRVSVSAVECRRWHQARPYDLIILDAFSPRIVARKALIAPWTPFVGLYGFLNGFEVHRTYFAFARMAYLMDCSVPPVQQPVLTTGASNPLAGQTYLCIAVGGEWAFRTYPRWAEVIKALDTTDIVLLGSENGREEAERLTHQFDSIQSFVGATDLLTAAAIIQDCQQFIGCDGGLWHIACALSKPTVALFADCTMYDERGERVLRDTRDMNCRTLYGRTSVQEIEPATIAAQILRQQNTIAKQHTADA